MRSARQPLEDLGLHVFRLGYDEGHERRGHFATGLMKPGSLVPPLSLFMKLRYSFADTVMAATPRSVP
jgi:hypothetical protein